MEEARGVDALSKVRLEIGECFARDIATRSGRFASKQFVTTDCHDSERSRPAIEHRPFIDERTGASHVAVSFTIAPDERLEGSGARMGARSAARLAGYRRRAG